MSNSMIAHIDLRCRRVGGGAPHRDHGLAAEAGGSITDAAGTPIAAAGGLAAAEAIPNPRDNAWMMTSTVLVLMMILPNLALFYGGLTRSKNMLTTMTQVGAAAVLAMVMWVVWGYGSAFGPEDKAFMAGASTSFAV